MERDNYTVEIESFCYVHAAGKGYNLKLTIDYNDNPDNILFETLTFDEKTYKELIQNENFDYGFVNSMLLVNNQYILNKLSISNTYSVKMTEDLYEINLKLDRLHKQNIQPLVKLFKLFRLLKGHEVYAANFKSIIKYKNLTTNIETTKIKICDSETPPYDRLQFHYLEEYSDIGKNGPEIFSFKEIDAAFKNASEQLSTTFEMFDNALLSSKLEMSFLCFIIALEGLFLIKDEQQKNHIYDKKKYNETKIEIYNHKYLSKSERISLRYHALSCHHEPYGYGNFYMHEMYKKRNDLIHFGRKKEITLQNVLTLRRTVSTSIIAYIKWNRENPNKNHNDFIKDLSKNFEKHLKELDEYCRETFKRIR